MTRRRGFTLIETLVALAIVAMTMTMVWGTFRGTMRAKSQVEGFANRYRTVRLALMRLTRDLQMAYLSQNEDTGQQYRRTQFVGRSHGTYDDVTFSYYGHQRLYKDADEGDTALVMYAAYTDKNDPRKTNLVRRESRRLQYARIDDMASEGDVICDDIAGFKLAFWDPRDKKFREEWVTTAADGQPDRLPPRVRITLSVKDERGTVIPFVTEARLPIQEPLQSQPMDVPPPQQQPGANNAGSKSGSTTSSSSSTSNNTRSAATNPFGTPNAGSGR